VFRFEQKQNILCYARRCKKWFISPLSRVEQVSPNLMADKGDDCGDVHSYPEFGRRNVTEAGSTQASLALRLDGGLGDLNL